MKKVIHQLSFSLEHNGYYQHICLAFGAPRADTQTYDKENI